MFDGSNHHLMGLILVNLYFNVHNSDVIPLLLDIITQVFVETLKALLSLSLIAENPMINLWVYLKNKMSHWNGYFND